MFFHLMEFMKPLMCPIKIRAKQSLGCEEICIEIMRLDYNYMVVATIFKTLSFKLILKQDLSTFTNLDVQIVEVIGCTYTQIKIINPI